MVEKYGEANAEQKRTSTKSFFFLFFSIKIAAVGVMLLLREPAQIRK